MLPETRKKALSITKRMLPVLVGVLIIGGFALKIGPGTIFSYVVGANLLLIVLAALLLVCSMIMKGLRWHLLVKPVGVGSAKISTYSYFLGQITNELLPMGSGEIVRITVLKQQYTIGFLSVVPAIVLERFLDLALLLLLSMILVAVLLNPILVSFLLIVLMAFLAFILKPGFFKVLILHLPSIGSGKGVLSHTYSLLKAKLIELCDSMTFYGRRKSLLFTSAVMTGVAWIGLEATSQYFLITAFGIHVSFITIVGVVAVSWVLGIASLLPGGLGTREAVYALALSSTGVPFEIGISIAMLYRAMEYVLYAVLAGTTYWLIKNDKPSDTNTND